jgi:alcohol dehydrogenase class IV
LAAAGGLRAMAIPTTLSGAEMTRGHRHARGVDPATPRVRPSVVVNDPRLSASQPVDALAASALNAFGHAAEALCEPHGNPVVALVAAESARLIARAFPARAEPAREVLALGALLGGYALDAAALGLHHVLAQTLVREAGIGHGPANAVMLPHTLGALAWRFPEQFEELTAALDDDPAAVAGRICALTGATSLAEIGVAADALPRCADVAAARDELEHTPPPASRAEILALYEHAY